VVAGEANRGWSQGAGLGLGAGDRESEGRTERLLRRLRGKGSRVSARICRATGSAPTKPVRSPRP
jgi:hypothetical protein